jgi:tetratricopeptide (TPR) repeat protein
MRILTLLVFSCSMLSAQDAAPATPAPAAEPAAPVALATTPASPPAPVPPPEPGATAITVTVPVVSPDIAPLAPPDLDSPYASPRDAARHRFQATLAELETGRNLKTGIQGFAEAFAIDRTYAAAAFNLGILCAIAEKWEDALSALEEATRLDPALGKTAASQIERLRLIRSLDATPDGKRRHAYDDALYPVLSQLTKIPVADSVAALAGVGKIDPKRWEAAALLAGLSGNGSGYDVTARFLDIALANASQPAVKQRLEKALEAAQRELRYAAARATADAAADRGEYDKAGELYEKTWAVIPARASNGMDAASAWLLHDDTAHAAALLVRLREAGDTEFAGSAAAMLKELEPIEPATKAAPADARDFFRDAGTPDPIYISDLLPPVDQSEMEILARPLPKLVSDAQSVVLLSVLTANPGDAPQSAGLPDLPAPRIPGESPWRELAQLRTDPVAIDPAALPAQERGRILVQTPSPVEIRVNGMPIPNQPPLELSLQPGLYRITVGPREREVNLKPAAHLSFH